MGDAHYQHFGLYAPVAALGTPIDSNAAADAARLLIDTTSD